MQSICIVGGILNPYARGWQRNPDSNRRCLSARRFSRPLQSTALPLRYVNMRMQLNLTLLLPTRKRNLFSNCQSALNLQFARTACISALGHLRSPEAQSVHGRFEIDPGSEPAHRDQRIKCTNCQSVRRDISSRPTESYRATVKGGKTDRTSLYMVCFQKTPLEYHILHIGKEETPQPPQFGCGKWHPMMDSNHRPTA